MAIRYTDYRSFKDFVDFGVAIVLVIITFPLQLILSLILYVKNGQVFFIQRRPGLHAKLFPLIKFKTMKDGVVISSFEAFLRKTSLDELPQLLNILLGQMSFVGPRPLLKSYLNLYSPQQLKRHDVKPGITGLAQINGRNDLELDVKVNFDLHYVESISIKLDLKILMLTFIQLLKWKEADYHVVKNNRAHHVG